MHHHLTLSPNSLDPLAWAGFASIFSYGFLTSLHCVGMCGPLACSVLSRQAPRWLSASLCYNGGRILSYSLAGAACGLLAQSLTLSSLASASSLSLVLGLILIGVALLQLFGKKLSALPRFSLVQNFWKGFHSRVNRWPAALQSLGLGLVTVFLPCMTLHPLLLAAASTQSALRGALSLTAFALGTLPAMVSATYMPSLLPRRGNSHFLAKLGPIFLILAGFLTILRAL